MTLLFKLFLFCLLLFKLPVSAQVKNAAITLGEKQTIYSSVLGESRALLVYTPAKMNAKLPLILVFDGSGLFSTTVAAIRYMNYYSEIPQMPEAIVIGIENTDRNRDMPIPQQYGGEKGEANFQKFIKDELLPWANKKYSLNGHNIVVGHSQGGLFASYLLASSPKQFPWVVALDAPMNIDAKTISIKASIGKSVNNAPAKTRYASIETAYGWEGEWVNYFPDNKSALQEMLPDETHESMAFKGVYDGLKFLYKDFGPSKKDMNLAELKDHYRSISEKYGYDYEIPFSILIASASRKIPENKKNEIIELLDYAETGYGLDENIRTLRAKTAGLTNSSHFVIDSFLSLPAPTQEQVKKYVGKWTGQFISKEGEIFPTSIDISINEGKPKLLTSFNPRSAENIQEPEIFHITKDGRLIFGIKNRGGGIIVNTLLQDKNDHLIGQGMWLGFTIPEDVPADQKKQLNFLLNTPTKFDLTRN